jgi:hypothetical protein
MSVTSSIYVQGIYSDPVTARLFDRLVLEFLLNLFFFSWLGTLYVLGIHLASTELPLHELVESAVWIRRQLLVCAFLSQFAVCTNTQNPIRPLDG